jgi:4-amino-4-deoxy-L-arabinose transferase-like glycosyltransferase
VAVGFVLRLTWVLFATAEPIRLSDPWHYQNFADAFASHSTMAIADRATAFYAPGYPMALAPLAWLTRVTGVVDLSMAASLLNVVAGTVTIVLVGELARRWVGERARPIAAGLMAVAPAPIFLTSVALSETLSTAVVTAAVLLVTLAVDRRWSTPWFALIGLVIGYATLVRTPGIVLVLVVPLGFRARQGRWHPALVPFAVVVLGTVVALVPWTVRNAVQVGIASPTSTNNVAFLCIDNRPGADGTAQVDEAESDRCFRGSPMDDPALYRPDDVPQGWRFGVVDEPVWYQTTLRSTLGWIRQHPAEQPGLMARRVFYSFNADDVALGDAEGFGTRPLVDPATRALLGVLATGWWRIVLVLAVAGVVLVRRCRAAIPIWSMVGFQVLVAFTGPGLQRFHHTAVPFLVVLAAGALVAGHRRLVVDRGSAGTDGAPAGAPAALLTGEPTAGGPTAGGPTTGAEPTGSRRRHRTSSSS